MVRVFTAVVFIGLLAQGLSQTLVQAPQRDVHFAETGLAVRGAFLEYFLTLGGLERFGYPISDELGIGDEIIQIFEYGALVHSVDQPTAVRLLPIAERLGRREPAPISSQRYPFPHLYYPHTGHTVAFAFQGYFESHGGLAAFGYPISEPLIENGRIVQYFQAARLEWDGQRVRLGRLGEEHVIALGIAP